MIQAEQCRGVTETGERCQTIVRYGKGYCSKHQQPIALPADNWLKALLDRNESATKYQCETVLIFNNQQYNDRSV